MNRWIRRLRGALGITAAWGVAGSVVGLLVGLGAVALGGLTLVPWLQLALGSGACATVLGAGFALTLMTLERGRSADELTPGRAAMWGGLAGAVIPLIAIGSAAIPIFGIGVLHPKLLIAAGALAGAYSVVGATLAALTMSFASSAPIALESGDTGWGELATLDGLEAEPRGGFERPARTAI